MPVIYKKLAWLEREELIKHFVSVEFNRFLQYYQNAPDINVDESRHSERDFDSRGNGRKRGKDGRANPRERTGKRDRKRGGYDYSRFFFNLGKKNGINKRKIIDLVNEHLPNRSAEIGSIEVMKNFSFFEVDKRYEKEIMKSMKNAKFNGQRIGIDIAKGK